MKIIEKYEISLGRISGIGACDQVVIGNFDPQKKEYRRQEFNGAFEILSLSGNITQMNSQPYLHLHISLGDPELKVWGGHLNYANISATAEIVIDVYQGNIDRCKDQTTGLNLWKL